MFFYEDNVTRDQSVTAAADRDDTGTWESPTNNRRKRGTTSEVGGAPNIIRDADPYRFKNYNKTRQKKAHKTLFGTSVKVCYTKGDPQRS